MLLLFQREKLTLGQASRTLGISQLDFQAILASRDPYIHYDVADLHDDITTLQDMGRL